MGTNYYWHEREPRTCETCGHADKPEPLHIGKSSAGWTFSFQVYPERGINCGADWIAKFSTGGRIEDEYGQTFTAEQMRSKIEAKRSEPNNHAEIYAHVDYSFVDADGHSCSEVDFS